MFMKDDEVYAEVRWDLMRYATALVGVSDASDVVSAVITRVLGRQGGLVGLDDPKPYLMRSILNEVRMRHRSSVRQARALARVGVGQEQTDENDHVLDQIMALPHQQRAAVFLAYYEQYTPTEIADLMGCRPATVRRYLHLARGKLKEAFDE
jgi:RNA polymerase sigma factor (sigma-70 family)